MTTFEEEVLERYFNLKGYFTIKNIVYSSPARRRGGKGRGEIDLVAVKLENGRVKEAKRVEVGVSISGCFPFIDKSGKADEIRRMIKKFFSKGAEKKLQELGIVECENWFITSKFCHNVIEKIEGRLNEFNLSNELRVKLLDIKMENGSVIVKIEYQPEDSEIEIDGVRTIKIMEFEKILDELRDILKKGGLSKKYFPDIIMRAIQHMFAKYEH
ncbi:MAG: hypothetical protein ABWW66_04875 [Archaeoglobaceae archaeon]